MFNQKPTPEQEILNKQNKLWDKHTWVGIHFAMVPAKHIGRLKLVTDDKGLVTKVLDGDKVVASSPA